MRKAMTLIVFTILTVAGVALFMPSSVAEENPAHVPPKDIALLKAESFWRCRLIWETDLVRTESGKLVHVGGYKEVRTKVPGAKKYRRNRVLHVIDKPRRMPELPPDDWIQPDFDDSSWGQHRGPFMSLRLGMMLLCMRGRFAVTDPARVGDLKFSLKLIGGARVFLNGQELVRTHLPGGMIKLDTPAEDYPREAYLNPDGRHLTAADKCPDRFAMRVREISNFTVPASRLRKGVNVLAVELHRAPAMELMYTAPNPQMRAGRLRGKAWWPRLELQDIKLIAPPNAAAIPNAGHAGRPEGFRVWNCSMLRRIRGFSYGEPNEPLRPIRIHGAGNGVFSGKVVIGSSEPILGLKTIVTELAGPGTIPVSAIEIRYALPDGYVYPGFAQRFDGLEIFPPAKVPFCKWTRDKPGQGVVQPVWVSVRVPRDARGGLYKGTLTISAEGQARINVPVELRVADWTLPDPKDFQTHVGLIQSPDSVAIQYSVPMWSERHFELMGTSFKLLGEIGVKVLYITMIRRTHFGNEHAMVRWFRKNGGYDPDLSIAEKYIDLAVKHMGKIPVVGLYCWGSAGTQGQGEYRRLKKRDRQIKFTLLDRETGQLEKAVGPEWGTPECRAFWKPAITGIHRILEKRGMGDSLMLGIAGDRLPTRTAMSDLESGLINVKWVLHAHYLNRTIQDRPVGYCALRWTSGKVTDPDVSRGYGWRESFREAHIPLQHGLGCWGNPAWQRTFIEAWLTASGRSRRSSKGIKGFGRRGADFWPVLKNKRGRLATLINRFVEARWSALSMNMDTGHVLAPGRDGAIATGRYEAIRESLQDSHARIFIEEALLDPVRKAKLGDALARRCRELLDYRIRAYLLLCQSGRRLPRGKSRIWFTSSGWEAHSGEIFELAAEVADRLE